MAEEVQMTAEGYQRLQDTLDKERQRRDDAIAQIAATRDDAMDLEDRNLETAQIDLPSMEARILELEDVLARAVIVEGTPEQDGQITLGSLVVLRDDERDREMEVRLVSAVEVDALAEGATQVSEDSPVGQALMGRRVGESFEVTQGERQLRYTVKSVG
ncbi:transcription elongation factor GreA [Deinococcus sp. HSC-46F16]|uniref:GreA/GreB family elongation factor n=1 Tax=Deinococcus sp. HSC-46F16 TaxID=2910968 RepID=UPI00209CBF90|nr:GreA/GreB family elongation factor [Deinococcus sp. HSC-46F16]MCP2014823.1 transcription elongation factor GreA [Deinococcus sp. HSC-46F16]